MTFSSTNRPCGGGLIIVGLLVLVAVSACTPRTLMIRELVETVDDGLPALEQNGDLELVRQALPSQITLFETLLASDPKNDRLRVLLARLYGLYGFGFIEADLEAAVFDRSSAGASAGAIRVSLNRYYLKGAGHARQVLEERHPVCRDGLHRVVDAPACFDAMTRQDVPALFWYGFNLGNWVNQNRDSIRALAKAHIAEKAMQRVLQLEPTYFHGGAHLFLMVYYASRPPAMGGNLEAAEAQRSRLQAVVGTEFYLSDVFYARYVLPQRQDRASFEAALSRAISGSGAENPYPLLNAVAARRAAVYRDAADGLFE